MTNATIKINNKEISTLAAEWLDAIETIPNESIYSKMKVREESMNLWNMFRNNCDMMVNGDVSIVVTEDDIMNKSKAYAVFVHSLPEDIREMFNSKFENFWDAVCTHMVLN
jgi:hypothetical protein